MRARFLTRGATTPLARSGETAHARTKKLPSVTNNVLGRLCHWKANLPSLSRCRECRTSRRAYSYLSRFRGCEADLALGQVELASALCPGFASALICFRWPGHNCVDSLAVLCESSFLRCDDLGIQSKPATVHVHHF